MARRKKFKIGDVVKIKGFPKSKGRITYIRHWTIPTKYKVREEGGLPKFWSADMLEKRKGK